MHKRKLVSITALIACCLALGVIALGAFTRLIDAGLGCPDWPGCYGHWIAPINNIAELNLQNPVTHYVVYKAWAEMIHRYFVGGLSCFILGIICLILIFKETRNRSNIIFIGCLFLLLVYQILLGQWTVTMKLLPIVVSQHLLGGFLILSVLWLIYLNNKSLSAIKKRELPKKITRRLMLIGAIIALVLLITQILLGAWTSTNYASFSCPDFPFCDNQHPWTTLFLAKAFNLFSPLGVNYDGGVLPETIRQTIQMTHRMGALILTIYLIVFAVFTMPRLKNFPELSQVLYIILGLLSVQLCLGMINVIFKLPLFTAIAHNLVAALLLITVITFIFKMVRLRNESYIC